MQVSTPLGAPRRSRLSFLLALSTPFSAVPVVENEARPRRTSPSSSDGAQRLSKMAHHIWYLPEIELSQGPRHLPGRQNPPHAVAQRGRPKPEESPLASSSLEILPSPSASNLVRPACIRGFLGRQLVKRGRNDPGTSSKLDVQARRKLFSSIRRPTSHPSG